MRLTIAQPRRLRRLAPLILVALALTAISSYSVEIRAASASDRAAQAPSTDTPDAISAAADQIESYGLSEIPTIYDGLIVVDGETHIDIYLTSLAPSAESAFVNYAPASELSFIQTPNSAATIWSVDTKINADWSELQSANGINLVQVTSDISTGKIVMQVENLTEAQTEFLDEQFGASVITVDGIMPAQAPIGLSGRASDSSPWTGSDSLGSERTLPGGAPDPQACSTGYSGYDGEGDDYLITDAHCFYYGEVPDNEVLQCASSNPGCSGCPTLPGACIWFGSGDGVGAVEFQSEPDLPAYGTDSELLEANGSGNVWLGPIGGPYSFPVSGDTTNPVGYDVCTDGSYDGEIGSNAGPAFCGTGTGSYFVTITSNGDNMPHGNCTDYNYAVNIPADYFALPMQVCHLIIAKAEDANGNMLSDVAGGSGDSGGPVFRFTDSGATLHPTGTIAFGENVVPCTVNIYPSLFRVCASTVEYSAMDSVLEQWGLTLDKAG